jgi:signal peptidase I
MLVCPVCGFRNPHSNDRCIKCSALLQRNQEIIDRAMYEGRDKARKQHRRDLILAPLERIQRAFDFPSWRIRDDRPHRFPFTAGALSIVPGLGQFYNHQVNKGLFLGALWGIMLALCLITLHQAYSNLLLILLLIGWILVWNDSVGSAIRMNGQRWPLRNSFAMLFAGMFLLGVTITGLQFFGLSIISFVRVRQDVHRPLIREKDHVFVNHVGYWFGEPHTGDVIYFDPVRITAEEGHNSYSINIKSYFQRVIGIEGDRVEKRQGSFFRNGMEIPRELWPIGGETLPDFSVRVPLGHVMAPVTAIPQDSLSNIIADALGGGTFSPISSVGQAGFVFPNWEQALTVPRSNVFGKAVAVVNPPQNRRWL